MHNIFSYTNVYRYYVDRSVYVHVNMCVTITFLQVSGLKF